MCVQSMVVHNGERVTVSDKKDARLVIRISRELREAALAKARLEDITVSQYVRRCLMQWVGILPSESEPPTEDSPEER